MRALADWVNLNFPLGMPEAEIVKAAESGKEEPVHRLGLRRPQPGAVRRLQLHLRQRPQGLRAQDQLREAGGAQGRSSATPILSAIDKLWQEHLYEMDSLRYSIGLRAHGQRDPLIEYKAEAFKIFDELMVNIKTEICHNIFRSASSLMAFENFLRNVPQQTIHQSTSAFGGTTTGTGTAPPAGPSQGSDMVSEAAAAVEKAKPVRTGPKVGRNDPCPCGSGKKYKQCCGKN